MNVSARNVFKGHVHALECGPVNAQVDVVLEGGEHLIAVVTQESVQELGLAEGREVVAIVKAPWVMLMGEGSNIRLSARNILQGTVTSVATGAVNTEVTLSLAGGTELTSVVTREAIAELGLRPGMAVSAVIKASSVILGVSA